MQTFQHFQTALQARGYLAMSPEIVLHGWLAVQDMASRQRGLSAILLDGPPGTGKSYFAEVLAEILTSERISFQFVPGTRREDLLYDLDLSQVILGMAGSRQPESFADLTSPGVLVRAAQASQDHLVVLHLDEVDKASEKIDAFLLEFLQEGVLNLPHIGAVRANPHKLLVVMTKNDQRMLTAPLMRRLRSVTIGYPPEPTEVKIVHQAVPGLDMERIKALVTLARKLRGHKDEMLHVPSTPELIQAARDLLVAPPEMAGHVVQAWLIRYDDDRHFLRESVPELTGTFRKGGQ